MMRVRVRFCCGVVFYVDREGNHSWPAMWRGRGFDVGIGNVHWIYINIYKTGHANVTGTIHDTYECSRGLKMKHIRRARPHPESPKMTSFSKCFFVDVVVGGGCGCGCDRPDAAAAAADRPAYELGL